MSYPQLVYSSSNVRGHLWVAELGLGNTHDSFEPLESAECEIAVCLGCFCLLVGLKVGGHENSVQMAFLARLALGLWHIALIVELRAVRIFQPKYQFGHPEKYLFLLSNKTLSGSKYPKKKLI